MADILIVEDNEEIGILLQDFFTVEGYDVYHALSGEEALSIFEEDGAKVVILDIMLPGVDGFEVCRRIRENSDVPILIVSAKGTKDDKMNGLILGADDYIEKPYDIDILLAKVAGIMKRRYGSDDITIGNIKLDKVKRKVFVDQKEVPVNKTEFSLLLYMMENRGKTLDKNALFNHVWGMDSENPLHIKTVWGVGYRFE